MSLLTALVIALKDGLPSRVIFVSDLLAQAKLVFELGSIYGTDESLAEMKLVDSKVDFQQLVHQIQHAPTFRILFR